MKARESRRFTGLEPGSPHPPNHDVPLGHHYNKYESANPIVRSLMARFLGTLEDLARQTASKMVLEAGCGEGHLLTRLERWLPEAHLWGIDLSTHLFKHLEKSDRVHLAVQSIYQPGFPRNSFDLVVAAEVLEHLRDPETALREIHRLSSRYVLLSVPREPLWRVMNMLRFAYWSRLGNTPGHLQNWSSKEFVKLISSFFEVIVIRKPLPWTVVLGVKKV